MFVKRRISQITSLVLLHSSWSAAAQAKWFCNPVLSCHSCALSWFACPIGVFVHYSGYHVFPLLAVGTIVLIAVLFGRLFCGWVCPFGFLMDLCYKIPSPKFTLPNWTGWIKYVILVVMVFLLPFLLGEKTEYSFCRICPAAAIQVTIPYVVTNGAAAIDLSTIIKFGILAAVLILAVLSSRSFCKTICPIGAILAPFNHVSFWAIKAPIKHCRGCKACDRACPAEGDPSIRIGQEIPANRLMECIVCHDCQEICKDRACELERLTEQNKEE